MITLFIILVILELAYFKIADRFHIIDKPNQRSSHFYITRRGGGIIFPVAWLLFSVSQGIYLPWFTLGLMIISLVSFLDDMSEVKVIPRISFQVIAFLFAFYDLGLFNVLPVWLMIPVLILSLGALNAVNFMDGINGITGLYAFAFWMSLAIVSDAGFGSMLELNTPFPYMILSIIVFGYFNFRRRAVCFAGDVGSVSMAYLMIGMVIFMMFRPGTAVIGTISNDGIAGIPDFDLKYLLLLAVYGIDSFLTIIHRLWLKENILKGHRKHLYQYLANELGWSHLTVASLYAALQLLINIWVLTTDINLLDACTLLIGLAICYVGSKYIILRQLTPVASYEQVQVTESNDLARKSA
jgi:UDP-N-acetylmuramyl pentapeptide phosphotransferase/UDP-N-acetylglucosamine-1-phosphate transferase